LAFLFQVSGASFIELGFGLGLFSSCFCFCPCSLCLLLLFVLFIILIFILKLPFSSFRSSSYSLNFKQVLGLFCICSHLFLFLPFASLPCCPVPLRPCCCAAPLLLRSALADAHRATGQQGNRATGHQTNGRF